MENPASLFGIPHLVSWIVLTPLIGLVIVGFLPVRRRAPCRGHSLGDLGVTLLTLGLAVGLWVSFDHTAGGPQFVDRVSGYRPLAPNTRV
jgi:NADH:ubiquinone oxidoreductase subunit 4 (subunit M)